MARKLHTVLLILEVRMNEADCGVSGHEMRRQMSLSGAFVNRLRKSIFKIITLGSDNGNRK